MEILAASIVKAQPVRLVLAKQADGTADLMRVQARPIAVKGQPQVSFVYRYRTRDVTVNLPVEQALRRVDELLGSQFHQANLLLLEQEVQISFSRRGKALLRTARRSSDAKAVADADAEAHAGADADADGEADADADGEAEANVKAKADAEDESTGKPMTEPAAPGRPSATQSGLAAPAHNRQKKRPLSLDRPFLQALGVTDDRRQLIPSMSRKWKQINRFIEVFAAAWKGSDLSGRARPLRVIDFGSGKGYLTFALHDYLRNGLGMDARTTGVELRPDLVKTCTDVVVDLGIEGLSFSQGDIASHGGGAEPFDVMIALHACDTATDDAIHQGISAGAAIIMCAPCCHKQLRPQLLAPHPLRPILQHGIHLGQQAEMLTDGLRALLLQAQGYDAQVFEFISLEHTSKNKMILAVKRVVPKPAGPLLAQIREIKSFYGITDQRLENLLRGEAVAATARGHGGPLATTSVPDASAMQRTAL